MQLDHDMKNLLVVLDQPLVAASHIDEVPVLKRALEVAQIAGSEIHLYATASHIPAPKHRSELRGSLSLDQLATQFDEAGISASYELRVTGARIAAVMSKVQTTNPDLVFMSHPEHAAGHQEIILRQAVMSSDSSIWVVAQSDPIDVVLTAVTSSSQTIGALSAADWVARKFDAELHTVQVKGEIRVPVETMAELEEVHVRPGSLSAQAPLVARQIEAGLVVFEVHDAERKSRLVALSAAAEVLERCDSDLLLVRSGKPHAAKAAAAPLDPRFRAASSPSSAAKRPAMTA